MHPDLFQRVADNPAVFQETLIVPSCRGPQRFGDIMADFQRERFASINPALLAVAKGETPPIGRHFWEATKGASKDSDLAVCLLWLLAFTRRPLVCQVGAADADQADELRKAGKAILRLNGWLGEAVTIQAWQIVSARTESTCAIIPADVTGSHGARPDVLVLNELSHVSKREFAENLLDNAAKVPNGLAVIATNAGHLDTWQWEWRELARASDRWHFHQRSEPAPWLNPAEIDEARRRNPPARFNRLWGGVWASGSGDAISHDDISAAVRLSGPMNGREPDMYFGGAIDLSTKRDHSAVVILAADPIRRRVRLANCWSWKPGPNGVDLMAIQQTVIQAHHRYQRCGFLVDPHQAHLMMQQLRSCGVPCIEVPFTATRLAEMASAMMQVFRDRQLDLYPDPQLLTDLGRLNIQDRGAFGLKLTAPADLEHGHADRAIAMSMAMPAALQVAMSSYAASEPAPVDDSSTWGVPVAMLDSPTPNMANEFPRRR